LSKHIQFGGEERGGGRKQSSVEEGQMHLIIYIF